MARLRTEFENLLVLEAGRPLVDCRVGLDRTLLTLTTSAEEVARLHGETVPLDLLPSGEGLTGFWQRTPIWVVVDIAGYNYPAAAGGAQGRSGVGRRMPGGRETR